jgi:(p)ppGpp synthase/HD superfamily hydrolase
MDNLILRAAWFARNAHKGQKRKHTGVDYISHPARVAGRVAAHPFATGHMVAAAFLHDTVEDTKTTFDDIQQQFGMVVWKLVKDLTDPTSPALGDTYKGVPRHERKAIMRDWIANGYTEAKIIKLFDRIDNLREMPLDQNNSYIQMYLDESRLLAERIGSVDIVLAEELLSICGKIT